MKELKIIDINKIKQYNNNPRYNSEAIDMVVQSINQCGYIAPIIVDENYEILAGHTRYQALKRLGKSEIEVLIIYDLSEEQKKKYRLLDNRTAEFSTWDFDKLQTELNLIDFGDFNFDFDDCLFKPNIEENEEEYIEEEEINIEQKKEKSNKPKLEKKKMLVCPHCGELIEI